MNAGSACSNGCAKKLEPGSRSRPSRRWLRDQFFTLLLDERRAIEAIPAMLDTDPELASRMGSTLRKLIEAARRGKQAREDAPRRDYRDVRVEEGGQGSQERCAEGGSRAACRARRGSRLPSRIGPIRAI